MQREIERLQERERERLRENEQVFEQSQIAPPKGADDDREEDDAVDSAGCRPIARVEIIGMTLYDPRSFLTDTAELIGAANLKPGYCLLNDDGSWAVVSTVSSMSERLTAYNLKVNEFHTYFVTGNAKAEPVWVHNNCNVPQHPTSYAGENLYFGQHPNQQFHTERRLIENGIDVPSTYEAIRADINSRPALRTGEYRLEIITVDGRRMQYGVIKLPDGKINVGRVTPL